MRASLAAVVIFILTFATSTAESQEKRQHNNQFIKLAETLEASEDIKRIDFAWIAVSEVTSAYEKVLEDSSSEVSENQKRRHKLSRWREGTREFIAELHLLLELISTSAEVKVHVEAGKLVTVFINNKPIVISGPEMNTSRLMERRIVDAYCELHDCGESLPSPQEPTASSAPIEKGRWILEKRQGAVYETPDGLVFNFSNLSGRVEKEQFCENIAKELRLLVSDLRKAKRSGLVIDWDVLEIQPLAATDASYVLLNKEGDYLQQNLPNLETIEVLRKDAIVWISKMVKGGDNVSLVIQADRLMQ